MQYYKFLFENLTHHKFKYQIGKNVLQEEWNPHGHCEKGGLYYTTEEFLPMWFNEHDYVAKVHLDPKSKVYDDADGKFKTDILWIDELISITDFYNDKEKWEYAVRINMGLITINPHLQTKEICLEVVKQYAELIEYVRPEFRTEEMFEVDTKQILAELIDLEPQNEKIFLKIIKQDSSIFKRINPKFQSENVCIEAIKMDAFLLKYVALQTKNICLEAVTQNGYVLGWVKPEFKTEEICLEAAKNIEWMEKICV